MDNNDAGDVIASRLRHFHYLRQVVLGATLTDLQQSGLEKLWDYGDIAKEALDAEVVSSRIQDGYKIDAVYINGAGGGEKGKDRIFCYYARPLEGGRKVPVMLDLTGGYKDDGKALYLAKKIGGACIDLEWRCTDAARRSTFPPLRGRSIIFG